MVDAVHVRCDNKPAQPVIGSLGNDHVAVVKNRGSIQHHLEGNHRPGNRANEDAFTIQLRDARNRFYSFPKGDLDAFEKQFDQSLMPSYATRLTASELEDLVAYLASLRGDR